VLTPHTTQPFPRDDCPVDSFYILAAGVFNLGFIGVGASARPFLDWWWQSTRRDALNDVSKMMFTDQRWIDLVPSLFDPYILKDPGCNVAYWNLHGRALTSDGDGWRVDGVPLRFFHFSGFDVDKPWLLSRHQGDRPRVLLSDRPPLRRLCHDYRLALQQEGIGIDQGRRYGWGKLACGVEFTETMRRLYRRALAAAEQGKGREPPDPFDEALSDAFVAWLNSPDEAGPRRLSRYLYQVYRGTSTGSGVRAPCRRASRRCSCPRDALPRRRNASRSRSKRASTSPATSDRSWESARPRGGWCVPSRRRGSRIPRLRPTRSR
jgi:hypothetical protein